MALEAIGQFILESDNEDVWELFHENSKINFVEPHPTYKRWPSDAEIVASMKRLHRVKPYTDFPKVALPTAMPASQRGFDDVLSGRASARAFAAAGIGLEQL